VTKFQHWSSRKRGALLATTAATLALVGIGAGMANGASTGIPLSGGQSASVTCSGQSLTISPVSPTTVNLNCVASPDETTTTTEAPTTTTPTTQPPATTTTTTEPPTTTTTTQPPGSTTQPGAPACVMTAPTPNGSCQFPDPQPEFTGTNPNSTPEVDTDMWNPISGASETLIANSPSNFGVVANMPKGNTGVVAYTNSWARDYSGTVDSFPQITESFAESMPHNAQTSGWAMNDLWFNNWADEVMIQYDFSNNTDCDASTVVATNVMFGGSNGVPVQQWHLCDFTSSGDSGQTLAWKLGATEGAGKQSESSGSIDIKAMIGWLETNGYLPAASTWTALSDGWEICSTGGQNETFSESNFSVDATS
jgi:hypothetical protein